MENKSLIDRYLKNELNNEEQETLQNKIKTDPKFELEFRFEVDLFKLLNNNDWALNSNRIAALDSYTALYRTEYTDTLKVKIKEAEASYKKTKKLKLIRRIGSIAAIFILAFSVYFLNYENTISTENLYATYLEKTDITSIPQRNFSDQNLESIGFEYYQNENYEKAISTFSKLDTLEINKNSSIIILLGLSYLKNNNNTMALRTFNLLNTEHIDNDKKYWFMALSYLKSKDLDKTKKLLDNIIKNNYYQNKAAKALKLDLEKIPQQN